MSSTDGPDADEEPAPGVWRYDYEAGSSLGSNIKFGRAMESGIPIIVLRKIANGVDVPHFPVRVAADDPEQRFFTVAIEDAACCEILRAPTFVSTRGELSSSGSIGGSDEARSDWL